MSLAVSLQVTFYTRAGCCLCDNALRLLRQIEQEYRLDLRIVDVTGNPRLEADYGDLLPVATCRGEEIFRYYANETSLRQFLDRIVEQVD